MRRLAVSSAALLLSLALAGCGSGDEPDVASDPGTTSASATTSTPAPTPTASPTVGSYPEFAATDYTYSLSVQCFCAFANTPVHVTVAGGEVVTAVYEQSGGGRPGTKGGDEAPSSLRLTINDVIAKANDTTAARVEVDWPAGQDYPNSVFVDHSKDMADDEIGYTVADVQVG